MRSRIAGRARGAGGMIGHGVTGWDMACRTLDCYVNSGVGHWMTWGSTWGSSVKSWQVTSDQTRKGTLAHWEGRAASGQATLSGQQKTPQASTYGAWWGLLCQLPARAERSKRRVKSKQRAK